MCCHLEKYGGARVGESGFFVVSRTSEMRLSFGGRVVDSRESTMSMSGEAVWFARFARESAAEVIVYVLVCCVCLGMWVGTLYPSLHIGLPPTNCPNGVLVAADEPELLVLLNWSPDQELTEPWSLNEDCLSTCATPVQPCSATNK